MLAPPVMGVVITPEEINNSGQAEVPDGEEKPKRETSRRILIKLHSDEGDGNVSDETRKAP
jgi:hypothetical protein